MKTMQTYRVLVRKTQTFAIDIAASSDAMATRRAEKQWDSGMKQRFDLVMADEPVIFEVDHLATGLLADIANEDRARWALTALRAYSEKTGSGLGEEGISDLVVDLAHLAEQQDIDVLDLVSRAIGSWAVERKDPESQQPRPNVHIVIGEGGEP